MIKTISRTSATIVGLLILQSTEAEAYRICTMPQFAREMEYRAILFNDKTSPQQAIQAGKDYDEMLAKYCREVRILPRQEQSEHVGDNCYQLTGTYLGKKVYWGQCFE